MERVPSSKNNEKKQQNPINVMQLIRNILFLCLAHWNWFLISLLCTMSYGVYQILTTPKVYSCTASILIKAEGKGTESVDEQLQELGIQQTSSSMVNEIISLSTTGVVKEIVDRLKLQVDYFNKGTLYDTPVYGTNLPVEVVFCDLNDNESATLNATLSQNGKVQLEDIVRNGNRFEKTYSLAIGDTINTELGKIAVLPSMMYKPNSTATLKVVRNTLKSTIGNVKRRISAVLRDKNSTVIDIKYQDVSIPRAEDILNMLILVYNENWVRDRNRATSSANRFIRERLGVIEQELSEVDQTISTYKSENLIPDVDHVGTTAMSQASAAETQLKALDDQIYMVRYIRNYLADSQFENQMLPASSGINNGSIVQQITEYNNTLMKRNRHLSSSSMQNPIVMELTSALTVMRSSIVLSLDNELAMLQARQRTMRSTHDSASKMVANNPQQAKFLLSIERQQQVKETLYLFLLQKREENELSQTFTAYNSRLIEAAQGGELVTPNVPRILIFSFLIGVAIPGVVLFVRESSNVSIRNRKELEELSIPFVGEVPLYTTANDKKGKKNTRYKIIVSEDNTNNVNEAFRIVRTNLEFMIAHNNAKKVVMFTSTEPGFGKTFISSNLATVFAIKGQKIAVIDLDLRKATLSKYVEKQEVGVSNFLNGQCDDYRQFVTKLGDVDLLPSGTVPPNPTELLASDRLAILFEQLRKDYDVIFVDSPPVDLVADASIINNYVDLTVFVVRALRQERPSLVDLENWYKNKKYNGMTTLFNAAPEVKGKYGRYRYMGYYGYGYGYSKK